MTIKCTGAEFKAFYNDKHYWVPHDKGTTDRDYTWHDDQLITIDGNQDDERDIDLIPDSAVVQITGGVVFGPVVGPSEPSLESYFRRWKREQTTTTMLVSCDKSVLDTLMAAIKAAGGRVELR